jgi:hypothetical protein
LVPTEDRNGCFAGNRTDWVAHASLPWRLRVAGNVPCIAEIRHLFGPSYSLHQCNRLATEGATITAREQRARG